MLRCDPQHGAQLLGRCFHRTARADDRDDAVDVVERLLQAYQGVCTVFSLRQVISRPADHYLQSMLNPNAERFPQVELPRDAIHQRQADDAERDLQLRLLEEFLQQFTRRCVALELQHDPHAVAVALVPQVRQSIQPSFARQLGDVLYYPLLAHLVWQLGDHERRLASSALLDVCPGPHDDTTAALTVRTLDPLTSPDDGACREVRPFHDLGQSLVRSIGPRQQPYGRGHDLTQVVRRHLGRHPYRDTVGPVDKQLRNGRGQNDRLLEPVVEVGFEVDGLLLDVTQQIRSDGSQPGFGIAIGCCWIAVDGAKIPLAVDQRIAHREVLGHPHQSLVDGHIAVRMVLAQDVADHGSALLVSTLGRETQLMHGIKDPALRGLEAVAGVG